MNVLITSAGRRGGLLKAFSRAVAARDGRVLAGDLDALAPALFLADEAIALPPVHTDAYIPHLLDVVRTHRVRLLVPTIDSELLPLANAAAAFAEAGCCALVSGEALVRIAGDKWETVTRFAERGIRVPASWLPEDAPIEELPDDLFVKPRDGSASQHTYRVRRAGLPAILDRVRNPIVQAFVSGNEITVDALLDLEGRLIHYVPRLRIRTVGGESVQGVTLDDAGLREWLVEVLEGVAAFGGRGAVTLQAFETDDGPVLSEINPRFGGGVPLTFAAGGDYPEWILKMVEGHAVPPRLGTYRRGLYMTRYYEEVFTEQPAW